MSCASAGLALPANSASVSLAAMLSVLRALSTDLAPRAGACGAGLLKMAGVEGFEPPYGGIKTRCLTTWRHPSRFNDSRIAPRESACTTRANQLVHGRYVQPPGNVTRPAVGHARSQALGIDRPRAGSEDTGTR